MWRGKIILFAIVVVGSLPLSASGFADFNGDYIVDLNDLAIFVSVWLESTTGPEDLDESGFVDFGDFSMLAGEWKTTTNPCNDVNVSGPWIDLFFTGIGPCGPIDCWIDGDDYSDYIYDNCGNYLYVVCKPTAEFGSYCAYNFYFKWKRVGLCNYACGINAFQVRKNASGKRILQTRHRTQDRLDISGCDEGTYGKYDWQIVVYNDVNGVKNGYCRESYLDPSTEKYWEPNEGSPSSCELNWW